MSANLYRVAVQVIILYESETWVLLVSIMKRVEVTHTEFLQMITGKRETRLGYGTCKTLGAEGVQEAA